MHLHYYLIGKISDIYGGKLVWYFQRKQNNA